MKRRNFLAGTFLGTGLQASEDTPIAETTSLGDQAVKKWELIFSFKSIQEAVDFCRKHSIAKPSALLNPEEELVFTKSGANIAVILMPLLNSNTLYYRIIIMGKFQNEIHNRPWSICGIFYHDLAGIKVTFISNNEIDIADSIIKLPKNVTLGGVFKLRFKLPGVH